MVLTERIIREALHGTPSAETRGLSTSTSVRAPPTLRFALRRHAEVLTEQYPSFGEMFERTLKPEQDRRRRAIAA